MYYFFSSDDTIVEGLKSVGTAREQSLVLGNDVDSFTGTMNKLTLSGEIDYTHKDLRFEHTAISTQNFGYDFIYNRVWVTSTVDFGLISELKTEEIGIWNALLEWTVSISDFTDPGDAGITIDTVSTPTYIPPNGSLSYTVAVSVVGPAEQYTTYDWTVGGEDFETLVIGTRLMAFPFPLNWEEGESISYAYDTSIYVSKTTHEQRRSQTDYIVRKSNVNFLLDRLVYQKFSNLIKFARGRYFVFPIYTEMMTTSTTLTGASSVEPDEDISDFFNLQNYCDYVVIVDHDSLKIEVKAVASVGATSVVLNAPINETFDITNTFIYPGYIGILGDSSFDNKNDSVITSSLTFQEVVINAV